MDALADVAIRIYAPMTKSRLAFLLRRLKYAVPQWDRHVTGAIVRATERHATARVDGVDWYWPREWKVKGAEVPDTVRLLAPFDPVVWDRDRFELFWGWTYRFEAYTPPAKRKLGYYALPLLWRDRVLGWANASVKNGALHVHLGYIKSMPRERAFRRDLEAEIERMREFLRERGRR
jgi:uncharacterized protein YcaQ